MKNINFNKPIKFKENLRIEKPDTKSGYNWGKLAKNSNILKLLTKDHLLAIKNELHISDNHIISERWIISDDRTFTSYAFIEDKCIPFYELLENYGLEILGQRHLNNFGPFISSLMKHIDTNNDPIKGSLSIQVHPKEGFTGLPAKPEMWLGNGKIYLGWKHDMNEEMLINAISTNSLEQHMNSYELNTDNAFIVPGGTAHAIRYNTFLFEWSKSPSKDDFGKGDLKNATIAIYDRTDGKKPRDGKENFKTAYEIMQHASTLCKSEDLHSTSHEIFKDDKDNIVSIIFNNPYVVVEKYELNTEMKFDTKKRGFPLFIEKGNIDIFVNNLKIDNIKSGEERFFPSIMGEGIYKNVSKEKSIFYKWYRPFY